METISGCWRRSSGPKLDLTEAAVATPLTEFTSGCACRLKPGQYQVQYCSCTCLCVMLQVLFSPAQFWSCYLASGKLFPVDKLPGDECADSCLQMPGFPVAASLSAKSVSLT